MDLREFLTIDKKITGGQPVFKGTRVSVELLFDHPEAGDSFDEFSENFPTIKEQVIAFFNWTTKLVTTINPNPFYATVA